MATKILFTDLDGTLLNDRKEVTPGNRAAIDGAVARGHRVVIATGRALPDALNQASRLGLDGPGYYVLCYNGAVLYDCTQKQVILSRPIPMDTVRAIFTEAKARGLHIQTYDEQYVLVEPWNDGEEVRFYAKVQTMPYRVFPGLEALTEPPYKALLIDLESPDKMAAFSHWVNTTFPDTAQSYFSSPLYLEVVAAGVDKGEAVALLCQRLGIPLENAIAAGDQANDISMILRAGTGVCMCNGIDEAKAAADYITCRDNNQDGIAEVIEKFMGDWA